MSEQQQTRKTRGVKAPSGNHYVVVNFTDEMKGKVITDEETVRAPNGRWWRDEDFSILQEKSMLRCPTYGTCDCCMSSGPMNGYCRYCRSTGYSYKQLEAEIYGEWRMIDAEWISHRFRATHLPAMADREVVTIQSNKIFKWSQDEAAMALKRHGNWKGRPDNWDTMDENEKWNSMLREARHIREELNEEVTWNPQDSEATILDPIADLEVPLPN